MFKDDDTPSANANIEFHLLDDYAEIFKENCNKVASNHSMVAEPTVVYCSKFFAENFVNS